MLEQQWLVLSPFLCPTLQGASEHFRLFNALRKCSFSIPSLSPHPTPPPIYLLNTHKEDEDQSLGCAIDWMFVFPSPKCMYWNLTPNVLAFGDRAFGVCLGQEGRALIIELVPLKKKPQGITEERPVSMNQKVEPHQTMNLPTPWPWTSSSELWEINSCYS